MRAFVALILAVSSLAVVAWADTGADHVKVDLLADTTAVRPSKPFTLGVRFQIDPGWHIYWTNPGDSGLPTTVQLRLPAGFVAGPVQYPVPKVLKFPGDITNYGYDTETTFLVTVTPPAQMAAGTAVPMDADAAWLVCQERCLPGHMTAHLTLATAPTAGPANAAAFVAARGLMPRLCDGQRLTSVETHMTAVPANPSGFACTVDAIWKSVPPDVNWVPAALTDWNVDDLKVRTTAGVTHVSFTLAPLGKSGRPLIDGLLVYRAGDGHRIGVVVQFGPGPVATGAPAATK